MNEARKLRRRATDALVVAPIAMTDLTCAALTGLEKRAWRTFVVKRGIPYAMQGHRMIVLVADYVAALKRASGAAAECTAVSVDPDGSDEPRDVDQLLARLGRRRAA